MQQIITLSGGQPSLLQQLCRDALNHLNHELFDLNLKRDVKIKLSDVEAVLNSDFFQRGAVYFDGVWHQTENEAQRLLLRQMATQATAWSLDALAAATELDSDTLQLALRWAERHDIVRRGSAGWTFCVPLMRRWLKRPLK